MTSGRHSATVSATAVLVATIGDLKGTGGFLYDFKGDIANYFATRVGVPVAGGNLKDAINFNNAHANIEMPFFNQDIFLLAQTFGVG